MAKILVFVAIKKKKEKRGKEKIASCIMGVAGHLFCFYLLPLHTHTQTRHTQTNRHTHTNNQPVIVHFLGVLRR